VPHARRQGRTPARQERVKMLRDREYRAGERFGLQVVD